VFFIYRFIDLPLASGGVWKGHVSNDFHRCSLIKPHKIITFYYCIIFYYNTITAAAAACTQNNSIEVIKERILMGNKALQENAA
jgi:hypothetical protein